MSSGLPAVRRERTGWRDVTLSDRHRRWGWDCPAVDIDFLFLEYDSGRAVAIVEYKQERAEPQYSTHPTYRALIDLGTRADIPVLGCRYAKDFSWWKVKPLNQQAKKFIGEMLVLTEREYVELLYRIRGRELPPEVFNDYENPL